MSTRWLARPGRAQSAWLADVLRNETIGGLLLMLMAIVAMLWANSPWNASYAEVSDFVIGPAALHLDLTVAQWTADGLLAVFFFIAGLELKHELVLGSLSVPSKAAVPIAAALGGMVVPALAYLAINAGTGEHLRGWGIPMATDIAFALAVLAVVGRRLPIALRAFLLTLAVADDLGAIIVIAVFYTATVSLIWLAASVLVFVGYALAQRARVRTPFLYVPLALLAWYCVHASGIHATVAGLVLGLLTRVRTDPGEHESPAERMQHRIGPFSAGVCVPLFALFAAGVTISAMDMGPALGSAVALGVIVGLVIGKPIGIVGIAWLTARLTRAELAPGIGFTVSLLVTGLAFGTDTATIDTAKLAVLVGTLIATALSAAYLLLLNRHHRRNLHAADAV